MVVNLREKQSQSKFGIFKAASRVKIDAEDIQKITQDIEDQHRQFMV